MILNYVLLCVILNDVLLHFRTIQTAVGVFGGGSYTDGMNVAPLMVANGVCPAITSLNAPPFIAVELCREHLVCLARGLSLTRPFFLSALIFPSYLLKSVLDTLFLFLLRVFIRVIREEASLNIGLFIPRLIFPW